MGSIFKKTCTSLLPEAAKCAMIAIQLAILVLLLKRFHLESNAFSSVLILAAASFPIHHFLPAKARLPMFVGVCLPSVFVVFGWMLSV